MIQKMIAYDALVRLTCSHTGRDARLSVGADLTVTATVVAKYLSAVCRCSRAPTRRIRSNYSQDTSAHPVRC
jgi:hypothetical protein